MGHATCCEIDYLQSELRMLCPWLTSNRKNCVVLQQTPRGEMASNRYQRQSDIQNQVQALDTTSICLASYHAPTSNA